MFDESGLEQRRARAQASRERAGDRVRSALRADERKDRYARLFAQRVEALVDADKEVPKGIGRVFARGILLPPGCEWLQNETNALIVSFASDQAGGLEDTCTSTDPLFADPDGEALPVPDAYWVVDAVDGSDAISKYPTFETLELEEDGAMLFFETMLAAGVAVNNESVFVVARAVFSNTELLDSEPSYHTCRKGELYAMINDAFFRKYQDNRADDDIVTVGRNRDDYTRLIRTACDAYTESIPERAIEGESFADVLRERIRTRLGDAVGAVIGRSDELAVQVREWQAEDIADQENVFVFQAAYAYIEPRVNFFGDTDVRVDRSLVDLSALFYMLARVLEEETKE